MKLTDKQHINLIDAFIEEHTSYSPSEFTGGSVSNTLTHNNTQIHYKINLYFGYNNKKPITKTMEISEDIYDIMYKAVTLKIKSMLNKDSSFGISDIEKLLKVDKKDTSTTTSTPTPTPTPTNTITYYLSTIDTNTIDTNTIERWLKYKKYKSIDGVALSSNFLSKYPKDIQKQIVDASIMNGWKGLFELKQNYKQDKKTLAESNREAMDEYERMAKYGSDVIDGVLE